MIEAAATARPVTTAGVALRMSARFPSTALDAEHVAAIAIAADQHLDPAAMAPEQPRRRSINFFVAIAARMCGSTLVP